MMFESISMFPYLIPVFMPLLLHWILWTTVLSGMVLFWTMRDRYRNEEWLSKLWQGSVAAVCLYPFCYCLIKPWFYLPLFIPVVFSSMSVWLHLFGVIYLIGVMFYGSKLLLQSLDLSRLKRNTEPCRFKPVQEILRQSMERLSIKRRIDMRISKPFIIPMTFGVLHPVVVVPLYAVKHLKPHQLQMLIAHELCHIKRHDYFFSLLFQLTRVFLWMFPFMNIMQVQAAKSREFCCDDEVLKTFRQRKDYADMFVTMAEKASQMKFSMPGAGLFHPSNLLSERFNRILQFQQDIHPKTKMTPPMLLFGIAIIVSLSMNTVRLSVSHSRAFQEDSPTPLPQRM